MNTIRRNIQIPQDFNTSSLENYSINSLSKKYGVSYSVIHRWMKEKNIAPQLPSNIKKETLFNLLEFKSDVECGNYTNAEIISKYNLSNNTTLKTICKRNDIDHTKLKNSYSHIDVEKFVEISLTKGKQYAANKFNITLAMATNFLKKNGIDIPRYNGLKNKIENMKEFEVDCYNLTVNGLSEKYKISVSSIKRIAKENNIQLKENSFNLWERDRETIQNNLDTIIFQNKEKPLCQISKENNYSIEQLKRVIKENNIPIVYHSINKSDGELEVKKFIEEECGFSCISTRHTFNDRLLEIDCFVKEKMFGVEYCGEYWHSDAQKEKYYHYNKFKWCEDQGIKLFTIFEHEWKNPTKNRIIKSIIKNKLDLSKRIFGRNTIVKEVPNFVAKEFHEKNHLNGFVNSSVNYGLIDKKNSELLSVLSLSKSRFDKSCEYEITRFSSKINTVVIGGFSKLFTNLPMEIKNKDIISYGDLRLGSSGNVYKNNGFTLINKTPPNYFYFDPKTQKVWNRMSFQKKDLVKMNGFSINKTENEIMKENGFVRIYDCGNYKYKYITNT